jgi:lysophospholipase L1-like esterase
VGSYVVLTGLEVRTAAPARAIVALGDSITDGGGAPPESRWAGVLSHRLRAAGLGYSVVNAGIACNDLTMTSQLGGLRTADRLKADVLDRVGVSHVILFEGTNDIYGGVPARQVTDALSALAVRIRAAGLRVIGATIIPRDAPPSPALDAVRRAVNTWIRGARVFDGVIDFDAVIRSADDPSRMNPAYNGDNIHPNVAGHIAMGDAINLDLFGPRRSPS